MEALSRQAIRTLRRRFGVPTGYSDHTTSTLTGALAVALGAVVLEKHFTRDRRLPGPDHAMSLAPAELESYVRHVRQAQASLGTGVLGYTPAEADVRRVARRSVVAARAIRAGEHLRREMLAVKRPAGGITPERLEQALGRVVDCDVPADAPITWQMLRE